MLPSAQRLSATEFSRVFDSGHVLRHPLLQLRVLRPAESGNIGAVRAAFVAPKKLGKAVQRNRIRRRTRERYRLLKAAERPSIEIWKPLEACDLIWIIGGAAQSASLEELDEAFGELLQRAVRFIQKSRSST